MFFSIRHQTRYKYDSAVQESIMEVRKQPRSEGSQRCLNFDLLVSPKTRVSQFRDHLGNTVHHFTVPGKHTQLQIIAESRVESNPGPAIPDRLNESAWDELDSMVQQGDYWEFLMPSDFAKPTPLLSEIAERLRATRRDDPLTVLAEVNSGMYEAFEYVPKSTRVDSPIDDALRAHRGVCQDFAHIMIALVRQHLRIPCRYVSGYLFHGASDHDRSADGATHAWVEALLPGLGWIGFDPTNDLLTGERHIRTAIGRDYGDVPPTHGVFKGTARSELLVGVQVSQSEAPPPLEEDLLPSYGWSSLQEEDDSTLAQQQQQQQ
jgi:transglutaminase-like putative cysteine protease